MLKVLLPVALLLVLGPSLVGASAPVVGPGAVIDLHVRLFAALDRGDGQAAADLVADGDAAVSIVILGADATCRAAEGSDAMKKLVAEIAIERKQQGGAFETKLVKSRADCDSERLSWGAFEIETKHTIGDRVEITRHVMTSIARWTKDGMRLVHGQLARKVEGPR